VNPTRVRYAISADGTEIAYAVVGSGPPLLIFDRFLGPAVGTRLSSLRLGSHYRALAERHTLVMFDWRGTGSSGTAHAFSLNDFISDVEAVVDAAGMSRFDLWGRNAPAQIALEYTRRRAQQVRKLVMSFGSSPGGWGGGPRNSAALAPVAHLVRTDWEAFRIAFAVRAAGWSQEARELFEDLGRHWTPESFEEFMTAVEQIDTRARAKDVACLALVVLAAENADARKRVARQLTASLRQGHLVEVPALGSAEELEAVETFLGPWDEVAATAAPQAMMAGNLRTILFTDIEGHTQMMARLGDLKGRDVLREHERLTREAIGASGGTEVKAMGDGFMASFGSAQRALECAAYIQRAFASVDSRLSAEGLRVRVGVNAGEPIEEENDLFGASVIAAARIAARAAGGEVLVSDVVRQLVAGKGFAFAARGEEVLRGFDDPGAPLRARVAPAVVPSGQFSVVSPKPRRRAANRHASRSTSSRCCRPHLAP